jgi:PilZ domain
VCYTGRMSDDKRASRRVMNVMDVDCRTADDAESSVAARISDLSATGAFLDSMNPLPAGTRLALRFLAGPLEVRVTAEVVHSMPSFGMGVRFLDLPPEGAAAIEALVREQP